MKKHNQNNLQSPALSRGWLHGLSCLALAALASTATPVHAGTKVWDGGGGTTFWINPLNWDTDTVPAANDDVIIDGAVTVDMNGLGSGFLPSGVKVVLTNGATLTISAGVCRMNGASTISVATNSTLNKYWAMGAGSMSFQDGAKWTTGDLELDGPNAFSFKLGPAGFAKLTPSTLRWNGTKKFTQQTWNVDMAGYTGGPASIILVDCSGTSGDANMTSANFLAQATRNVTNPGIYVGSTIVYDSIQAAFVLKVQVAPYVPPLADLVWDGGGGTVLWNNAANWDPDFVPVAGATVAIASPVTVEYTGNLPACYISLTSGGGLKCSSGAIRMQGATINVASNSVLSGGYWDLNAGTLNFQNGAGATMSDWELKGVNRFSFKLGAAGFTPLLPGVLRGPSPTTTISNSTWIVDMANYTGGTGIITLVDYSTDGFGISDTLFQTAKLIVTNAAVGYTANLQWNNTTKAVELNVTDGPPPTADITWDGGGGDNLWVTALNWDTDTVPVANNVIAITNAVTVDLNGLGSGNLPANCNILLSGNAGLTQSSGAARMNGATINVASNSVLAGGFWDLNNGKINFQNGAKVTFTDWEQKGVNRFSFKLGKTGFTTILGGTFRGQSPATTIANATYIADMANYTNNILGAITLVDFGTDAWPGGMSDALFQTAALIVTNAGVGYTANLQWNSGTKAIELNVTAAPGAVTPVSYYWDNNGATAGFGTAAGTWAATTTGDATQGWSTNATGSALPVNVTPNTLDFLNFGNGATGLGAGTITVSGSVTNGAITVASGSGDITFSGGTINFAQSITVNNPNTTILSTLAGNLKKDGSGNLILPGAQNTYTGVTTVNGGILAISNSASLGATSGNTIVNSGATLRIAGGISIAEPLRLTGSGVSFYPDPQGALLSSGTNTLTGLVTLSGARLATEGTDTLTFTGGITNASGSALVGAFAINNNPINAGTGGIAFAGDGAQPPPVTGKTIQLNAAGNTWSGATLYFAAIVRLGVDNAMPTGATVSFGFLNDDLGRSTLDLNGHNQTVASIETHSSALSASGTTLSITGGGTLTVNQSAASKEFTGVISDGATPTALTKDGTGTLILSGDNTYSGATTVSNGVLQLTSPTATGLGPNTSVYLITPGNLDLNFGGYNQVTALYIDGVKQPNGIYGAGGPIVGWGFLQVGPPSFTGLSVSGTDLTLNVTGGTPNGPWTLLSSTDVALPLSQWVTISTGTYDGSGVLSTTLVNVATNAAEFFRLK